MWFEYGALYAEAETMSKNAKSETHVCRKLMLEATARAIVRLNTPNKSEPEEGDLDE